MPEVLSQNDVVDGIHHSLSNDQIHSNRIDDLCSEQYRLDTFSRWPHDANVSKNDLAKDGFYYLGDNDRVKCAFCNLILLKWERRDNIRGEHQKNAPRCSLIVSPGTSGNIPYQRTQRISYRQSVPKHSEYKDRAIRVRSFNNWPPDVRQKPEQLAAAGFFYLGTGDGVKCFHCGGVLRSWDDQDNPWDEHKSWFPSCPFILQNGEASSNDHRRFLTCIARENGYSDELLSGFDSFCDDNNIPYPESYDELVDQLEQLQISQNSGPQAATGFTPYSDEVFTEIPEEQTASRPRGMTGPSRANRRSIIQTQWNTDNRFECKICFENHVEVIFLPCRHVCCCQSCCNKLRVKECPICRSKIKGMQPLYFA